MGLISTDQKPKFVILIIMDGVGAAPRGPGNAVAGADTKNLDELWPKYPHGMLEASGLYVGLPKGTDGNSEVGHMTLGSGKIILQDLPRIDNAVENGSFIQNPILNEAFDHAIKNNSFIHLMGLIGNGYVHSSFNHLVKLLDFAVLKNIDSNKLLIHAILDGRDSSQNAGLDLLDRLEAYIIQRRVGVLASIIGRAYAMDRNKNWIRTRAAYDLYTETRGKIVDNWRKELSNSYSQKISDEYIEPLITSEVSSIRTKLIQDNDSVVFFNYRPDRAQQITRAFEEEDFPGWERKKLQNLYYCGFTDYKNGFPKKIIFPQERIIKPLGKILSENNLRQIRIAESEKFPHVTYFFNGGNGLVFENEKWLQLPSPQNVATYDLKPEMSQRELKSELLNQIDDSSFDFAVVNFAGPDMVAHTANIEATKKAMEVCDECVGQIVSKALELGGAVIITADHGNAEELIDLQSGAADTKHSTNQVPIMIIKNGLSPVELPVGGLADVAPTILSLFGITIPPEITGKNLLE